MNKEELIRKLQMVYAGEKNVLDELVGYYDGLQEIIKLVKEENKRLEEKIYRLIKKEYKKNNDYTVKVRTEKQLEREQYLLNFKSKSVLASMLIDAEDNWNKLKEYCQLNIDKPNIKFILETMQELESSDSDEQRRNN